MIPVRAHDDDLPVDEVHRRLQVLVAPIRDTERVHLFDALGPGAGWDLVSPIDVPAHDNAAMDGYAFDGQALQPGADLRLRIVGALMAGEHRTRRRSRLAWRWRIMTGAAMPPGADTVILLNWQWRDGRRLSCPAGCF